MRKETTFADLPINARFFWGHNGEDYDGPGVIKLTQRSCRAETEKRSVSFISPSGSRKPVTWMDAPDADTEEASPEETPVAASVERWNARERALRTLVAEMQLRSTCDVPCDSYHRGYMFAHECLAKRLAALLDETARPDSD